MEKNEILTVADLLAFEERLKNYVQSILKETQPSDASKIEYLRTRGVKKLLKVSDNKLKAMRECGDVEYTFVGKTYYYNENSIRELLENNTIKK